jgi:hypothetical protein
MEPAMHYESDLHAKRSVKSAADFDLTGSFDLFWACKSRITLADGPNPSNAATSRPERK